MTVTVSSVEAQLRASAELTPISTVEVTDRSGGCGSAFHVRVESPAFAELSLLERQRLVHKALGDTVSKLHALTMECKVPANSGISASSIEEQLRASSDLAPLTLVEVTDTSGGCGSSFAVYVVSAAFEGHSMLQQQRFVHKALGETVEKIHALTIKCRTAELGPSTTTT